jgi:hypothetical protein
LSLAEHSNQSFIVCPPTFHSGEHSGELFPQVTKIHGGEGGLITKTSETRFMLQLNQQDASDFAYERIKLP